MVLTKLTPKLWPVSLPFAVSTGLSYLFANSIRQNNKLVFVTQMTQYTQKSDCLHFWVRNELFRRDDVLNKPSPYVISTNCTSLELKAQRKYPTKRQNSFLYIQTNISDITLRTICACNTSNDIIKPKARSKQEMTFRYDQ